MNSLKVFGLLDVKFDDVSYKIPRGGSPIKMTGCSSYLLGVKICRLVPHRVL